MFSKLIYLDGVLHPMDYPGNAWGFLGVLADGYFMNRIGQTTSNHKEQPSYLDLPQLVEQNIP
jgi:hypothetical protein